jgi:hypothetical protein
MDKYELAEKANLPELYKTWPKTVEVILLIRAIFSSIFSTKITNNDIFVTIVVMWIIEGIVSACILTIGLFKENPESTGTILLVVLVLQFICLLIHMMVGHIRED